MSIQCRRRLHAYVVAIALCWSWPAFGGGFDRLSDALGPLYRGDDARQVPQRQHRQHRAPGATARDSVRHWNELAVDASGLDHSPVLSGDPRLFGEQLGPGRASRSMAIVHIAIFDALNAIDDGYQSYTGIARTRPGASPQAAVAQAAHDTLEALFPSQSAAFDAELAVELNAIRDGHAKNDGVAAGRRAAAAILALRTDDGSNYVEPRVGVDFIPTNDPGFWRQDPVSLGPLALGAQWGAVTPFVLRSGDQFRAPPPPALGSDEYARAFHEVKALGGDGLVTPTIRTREQTFIGTFWAYDGTPSLCAPPRLYNQIAMQILDGIDMSAVELARRMALVNVAMADAGIAIWESKYHFQYWRPVAGIREADAGGGPSGLGDGNSQTVADLTFMPLGAPASNLTGPNFTPPFPSYPSGHAGFGGALFEMLGNILGTDAAGFTLVSDEFNGETTDDLGNVRPLAPRSFETLSDAEDENGQSRIYLGIHWKFDKTEGIALGRRVSDFVFEHAFLPLDRAYRSRLVVRPLR